MVDSTVATIWTFRVSRLLRNATSSAVIETVFNLLLIMVREDNSNEEVFGGTNPV